MSGLTVTWVADDGVGVGGVVGSLELVEVDVVVLDVLVEADVDVGVGVLVAVLDELAEDVEVGVGTVPPLNRTGTANIASGRSDGWSLVMSADWNTYSEQATFSQSTPSVASATVRLMPKLPPDHGE